MEHWLIVLIFILGLVVGAILHERDMYNNYLRDGNAHAWTCDIKK